MKLEKLQLHLYAFSQPCQVSVYEPNEYVTNQLQQPIRQQLDRPFYDSEDTKQVVIDLIQHVASARFKLANYNNRQQQQQQQQSQQQQSSSSSSSANRAISNGTSSLSSSSSSSSSTNKGWGLFQRMLPSVSQTSNKGPNSTNDSNLILLIYQFINLSIYYL